MERTTFLSRAFGLYFIVVSLSVGLNMQQFSNNLIMLVNQPALLFVLGFMVLVLGVLLVAGHSVWTPGWSLLVTILGYLTFIKGVLLLFYPQWMVQLTASFLQTPKAIYVAIAINFALGLLLSAIGWRRA